MSVCAKFQLPSMSRSGWKVCVVGWGGVTRGYYVLPQPKLSRVALSWVELSWVRVGFWQEIKWINIIMIGPCEFLPQSGCISCVSTMMRLSWAVKLDWLIWNRFPRRQHWRGPKLFIEKNNFPLLVTRIYNTPPKCRYLVYTPLNRLCRRKFLKENFVSQPQKSKIVANILYN